MSLQESDPELRRKPVPAWREEVRFDRKPEIWCLDPVMRRQSANLGGHCRLSFDGAEMLDHRVAEHHIERAIGEFGEVGRVAPPRFDVLMQRRPGIEIHQYDMNVLPAGPAALLPEGVGSSDVEDADGTLVLLHQSVH